LAGGILGGGMTSINWSLCIIGVAMFALSACGGGGGGNNAGGSGSGDVTSYTVTATAGSGGSISPVSVTVSAGATASFTVTPDSGNSIASVTGCGGNLIGNTYTTASVDADCTVTASFVAILPSISITDASVVEGDMGTTSLDFSVNLSAPSNSDVRVDYATSNSTAIAGEDYIAASGTLTIPAGKTSGVVTISIHGDTVAESNETFVLTLSNPTGATLAISSAVGTIINDEVKARALNDTGRTTCFTDSYTNQTGLPCNDSVSGTDVFPGQDAEFGRDVTAADDSDGHAGFSFTKLDSSGSPLPASATSWTCVRDEVTGLVWEVKTQDGGLRDAANTYTWYNTDSSANGGFTGVANGGACIGSDCDTQSYVQAVNAVGLCGFNDWRMPTAEELSSLLDASVTGTNPAIDTNYFPNAQRHPDYWSGEPSLNVLKNVAWRVSFGGTFSIWEGGADNKLFVRLVRD
jgi:hypothetical protein